MYAVRSTKNNGFCLFFQICFAVLPLPPREVGEIHCTVGNVSYLSLSFPTILVAALKIDLIVRKSRKKTCLQRQRGNPFVLPNCHQFAIRSLDYFPIIPEMEASPDSNSDNYFGIRLQLHCCRKNDPELICFPCLEPPAPMSDSFRIPAPP